MDAGTVLDLALYRMYTLKTGYFSTYATNVLKNMNNRPRLDSTEPIIINGKKKYENEWDRVRSMYFDTSGPKNEDLDELERLDRYNHGTTKNHAR